MSIPTPFNPLGTLGAIELLESVHISCAEDEPYENLVETAFGEPYYLEPFGSEGYFAEVAVINVSGMNVGTRKEFVSIGGFSSEQIGSLIFYSWGEIADTAVAQPQCYHVLSANSRKQFTSPLLGPHLGRFNNFGVHHRAENGVYSGEAARFTISEALGTWSAAQNTRARIIISKIPGLSYDFKKLVAHTENVKFDALPARKRGKNGIAIFINDRLEKFVVA